MKWMIAALCICCGMSAMAQTNNNSRRTTQPRQIADMVVDTAVINRMELNAQMVESILALQKSKQAAMQEMMKNSRPQKGERMSDEQRKALREQREAFTAEYRGELRKIMGDPTYITYLEKLVDSRAARQQTMQRRPAGAGQMRERGQRQMMDGNSSFDRNDF